MKDLWNFIHLLVQIAVVCVSTEKRKTLDSEYRLEEEKR